MRRMCDLKINYAIICEYMDILPLKRRCFLRSCFAIKKLQHTMLVLQHIPLIYLRILKNSINWFMFSITAFKYIHSY